MKVVWKEGESALSENVDTSAVNNKLQVSKVTVVNPRADRVFTCFVSSTDYTESKSFSKEVHLKVYGKYFLPVSFMNF